MAEKDNNTVIRIDAYTRVCLTTIAVLLSVLIAGLWAEGVSGPAEAMGQDNSQPKKLFIDSASQRKALIEAQNRTTERLEELVTLFTTGKAKVQITEGNTNGSSRGRTGANVKLQVHKSN